MLMKLNSKPQMSECENNLLSRLRETPNDEKLKHDESILKVWVLYSYKLCDMRYLIGPFRTRPLAITNQYWIFENWRITILIKIYKSWCRTVFPKNGRIDDILMKSTKMQKLLFKEQITIVEIIHFKKENSAKGMEWYAGPSIKNITLLTLPFLGKQSFHSKSPKRCPRCLHQNRSRS